MEIESWKAMLARRGYKQVRIWQEGSLLKWEIEGVERGQRRAADFVRLSYQGLRKEIDRELGHRMTHVQHVCGYPLLKAPRGFTSDHPFYRVQEPLLHVQFFAVPLYTDSPSLLMCPHCGKVLQSKDVHRIKDPEAQE